MADVTVKVAMMELLEKEPKRYSDLVRELGRPDKTVYVTLAALSDSKYVSKDDEGRYIITDTGRRELERVRFVRLAEEEDDLGIILNTKIAIALGRCYDLLLDLRYILSRTLTKSYPEERSEVKEKLVVIRNLLLKYNPSLKREELERNESKGTEISIKDLLSGGILWEKRFIKWGLKDRYLHLLNLAKELPKGAVRDEIFSSLTTFRKVAGKLDNSLISLEAPMENAALRVDGEVTEG
jgi:DNA-binding PadR family transcriptional regulator